WVRRRRRDVVDPSILEALSAAMTAGDDDGIRAVLQPDVELVIDSGALPSVSTSPGSAPGRTAGGRDAAVAGLRAIVTSDVTVTMASVNSLPGLLLVRRGAVVGVLTADMCDRLLANVWVVCNPDKLRHWNR
ncbi:MAG TPA: hypothetical protein VLZ82_04265, partial [Microbacterium sp.]|nr:hypothetical protein [Microbacterium sp.]